MSVQTRKIFFGGVARNIGSQSVHYLRTTFDALLPLLPDNTESKIFIYENDSDDDTVDALVQWATDDHRVSLVCEKNQTLPPNRAPLTWDFKTCRMERIGAARNKLMEMLEGSGEFGPTDLIVMIDLDIPCPIPVGPLAEVLTDFPDWADALFANGGGLGSGSYYDGYAWRSKEFPFGPELTPEDIYLQNLNLICRRIDHGEQPIPVFSAFGGLAIYRAQAICGIRYSATPTDDYNWLYSGLYDCLPDIAMRHDVLKAVGEGSHSHYHGALLGLYLFGIDGLFYRFCSGYNWTILCEHVPFHASMIRRGHGRLFVMPSLLYYANH